MLLRVLCAHDGDSAKSEVTSVNILSVLKPQHRPPTRQLRQGVRPAPAVADADCPMACGWFDSSHELLSGLIVCEHATLDTLAGELPLANWLELHLLGWRGPCPAPVPRW